MGSKVRRLHSHHSQLLTNGGIHGDKQIEVEKGKKEAGAITTASITTGTETVRKWLGDPPGLHDSAGAVCVLSRLGSRLVVIEIAKIAADCHVSIDSTKGKRPRAGLYQIIEGLWM
jgi:hypothetical protein